jgi:two-component system chemotaxis response regulator CheY
MVPEIQGHDVVRMIRETEQKENISFEKKAKIIMTTSLSDAENIIKSFRATCHSYLVKPVRKAGPEIALLFCLLQMFTSSCLNDMQAR